MKKKIIFLDFDGVLNTSSYYNALKSKGLPHHDWWGQLFDPECVKNLKYIIDETGADIVVSSSWKDFMSCENLLKMWKDRNLPGCVADKTPSLNLDHGVEIEAWLNKNNHDCQYVIIDDLEPYFFHVEQQPFLLCVNSTVGLTREIAESAVNILNRTIKM